MAIVSSVFSISVGAGPQTATTTQHNAPIDTVFCDMEGTLLSPDKGDAFNLPLYRLLLDLKGGGTNVILFSDRVLPWDDDLFLAQRAIRKAGLDPSLLIGQDAAGNTKHRIEDKTKYRHAKLGFLIDNNPVVSRDPKDVWTLDAVTHVEPQHIHAQHAGLQAFLLERTKVTTMTRATFGQIESLPVPTSGGRNITLPLVAGSHLSM